MKGKIVCWIGDAPNHRALAARLARSFNVGAIVVDRKKALSASVNSSKIYQKLIDNIRFRKIYKAWGAMQEGYRKISIPETIPILVVDSINDPSVLEFTKAANPDLIVVSGTSLVKEPLVSLPLPIGIMNLHTGLSPYVKGGPNCTNWCIANNEWSYVGNTIMWLSAGIDSGNIIVTEQTPIENNDDLTVIHKKVMAHAHELYERAVRYVVATQPPYQSIPQSTLGKGNLYLSRMWTKDKKMQLLKNLSQKKRAISPVKTIPLPS